MTNDYIAKEDLDDAVLAHIDELIREYQEGLARHTSPSQDTNIFVGIYNDLTSLDTGLDAFKSLNQVVLNTYVDELLEGIEAAPPEEPPIFECSITDQNNFESENFFTNQNGIFEGITGVGIKGLKDEPGVAAARRITNKFNFKIRHRLNSALNDAMENDGKFTFLGHDFNFGIDRCFECKLDFDSDIVFPEINYILDFRNLLNETKRLLEYIRTQMDPTVIVSNVCHFLKMFGENALCPSGLIGIQYLLPTLFAKYSRDALSINLDFTVILGGLVKNITGNFSTVITGIKLSLLPYIDCLINVFVNFRNYYVTIIKSGEKIFNESVNLGINKPTELFLKTTDMFGSVFAPKTKKQLEEIQKQLEGTKRKQKALDERYTENYDRLSQITEVQPLNKEEEKFVEEFLNNFDPEDRSGNLKDVQDILKEFTSQYEAKQISSIAPDIPRNRIGLKGIEVINNKQMAAYKKLSRENSIKSSELTKKKEEMISSFNASRDSNISVNRYDKGSKAGYLNDPSKGTKEVINLRKNKVETDPEVGIIESLYNQYNINITDQYFRSERVIEEQDVLKNNFMRSNDFLGWIDDRIKDLKEVRKESLAFINKVQNTLSGLGSYTSESIGSSIRLNGEMLNIIHTIRAIKVVYNLIQIMGDLSCADIMEDPSKVKTFNQFFNDLEVKLSANEDAFVISQNIVSAIPLSTNKSELRIDKKDCGSFEDTFNLNSENLDQIYEGIKDGYFGKI